MNNFKLFFAIASASFAIACITPSLSAAASGHAPDLTVALQVGSYKSIADGQYLVVCEYGLNVDLSTRTTRGIFLQRGSTIKLPVKSFDYPSYYSIATVTCN